MAETSRARPARLTEQRFRVALVTEYYYPHLGGICEHVSYLSRELRARGHHVDIITSAIRGADPGPGVIRVGQSVSVYANASHARFTVGLGMRRRMRNVLRRGKYDVVHVHCPPSPTLPYLAMDVAECPVVGTTHTDFRSWMYRLFNTAAQRHLDKLAAAIAVSQTAADAMARYFDVDWEIIPNGVDVNEFRPNVPRPPEFARDTQHVLFLGRLDPRNGLATLIPAFQQVRDAGRRVRLIVVGGGPLRKHYERMAGNDPDIVFVGPVHQGRASYYAHSDVYACPTTRASFGITLLEAMACATPIVCSDLPGFRNVVRPDVEALMVPHVSPGGFADGLARVLDDRVLRARLSRAGRVRAQEFAWSRVTDQILSVYARVTTGAREAAR